MDSFTKSLLTWLDASFVTAETQTTPERLSDGVLLAFVLHQIDADFFDAQWAAKLKKDCGDNWRLKASNVKKVIGKIVDYYNEVLCISLTVNETQLASSVGEHSKDVGRLLQLVLGTAVNCNNKEKYIQIIMGLEEAVQHVVMKAIQEIMANTQSLSPSMAESADSAGLLSDEVVKRLEVRLSQEEKLRGEVQQKLHDLERVLQAERQEKTLVVEELRDLQNKLAKEEAPQSLGDKVRQQRDQQTKLESELFRMEMQKEEFRSKLEEAEGLLRELQSRNEELMKDREDLSVLKDELDVLRHTNEQVGRYEASLEMYRKKMEEMSDMKKQFRVMEEKNAEYLQTILRHEEELSRVSTLKAQIDVYKKETHSLRERLTEEIERADHAEFENRRAEEKLAATLSEKERILNERNTLRENIEELKLNKQSPLEASAGQMLRGTSDLLEDPPALLKEKLYRLQSENEVLKKRQTSNDTDAYKELHDDMKKLQEETEQKLRAANLKILELESQSADNSLVRELNDKIAKLTRDLDVTKQELRSSQEKYEKCLTRAKSVLKNLNDSGTEAALRHELSEKNQLISKLERDVAHMKTQYDSQERLIMTALHNFGAHEQRHAAERRLTSGSFLNTQRQSTARKHNLSGVQSSEFFK